MIKLPVCTSVCIVCISDDSPGQTPRVLLASWLRSWPRSALICLLLRWWRQTSGSPLSLVQVYCSESPASVLWMRKLSTRADGLLELLVALASGYCKLKFRRICPSRSFGLQNAEMPLVSSSASPGPLLWLMGLNALSPALLVHTALPLPEILSSPPLCVPLADFCTALQPSIADTSSVKPSQRGQGRGSLLLACCSLFLQPRLV